MAELVEFDRLEEVMVGPGAKALGGGFGIVSGGQDDDAHFGPAPTDLADQPEPAPAGHAQVGDDDRREVAFEQFQGLFGVAGRLTLELPGARSTDKDVLSHRLVFNDRDRKRRMR